MKNKKLLPFSLQRVISQLHFSSDEMMGGWGFVLFSLTFLSSSFFISELTCGPDYEFEIDSNYISQHHDDETILKSGTSQEEQDDDFDWYKELEEQDRNSTKILENDDQNMEQTIMSQEIGRFNEELIEMYKEQSREKRGGYLLIT
jgi:hypothetical protein